MIRRDEPDMGIESDCRAERITYIGSEMHI